MTTVADILAAYLADRKPVVAAPKRIERAIRDLSPLHTCTPVELTRKRQADYIQARINAGVVHATVRRDMIVLRAALRLAWRDHELDRVPYIPMPPRGPARQRVLSRAEITRMGHACREDDDPSTAVLWHLLLGTASRITALLELTWARVDLDARSIDLRRSDDPLYARRKGRAVVPMDRSMLSILRAAHKRADGDHVLPWRDSGAARRRLRRCARRAAVEGLTPHVMRHTAATWLLRSGVSLLIVSRMLGHKSVATTEQEYGHLLVDDLTPAAQVLGRLSR